MTWYDTVFEVIDMRSFSNLWYWIALAVLWSSASYWVLGVPLDMINRAKRQRGNAMEDFHDLVRINVSRILYIAEVSGVLLLLFGSAFVTALVLVAFYYWIEFAQAVLLLGGPLIILGAMSVQAARHIRAHDLREEDLIKFLMRLRFATQIVGVIAIFVTAMFGMYQNLYLGPFGGF